MKKTYQAFGNTWEQLTLLAMESPSSSAVSEGSRRGLGKNTHDPSWDLTNGEKCDMLSAIDSHREA